jgi:methylated-DNA-[protein]-cysteine S-methyltransferase
MMGEMKTAPKDRIRELLQAGDFNAVRELAAHCGGVLRHLVSLTYDKSGVICWRAIEAVGIITAAMTKTEASDALNRVLWMMRDESGGNPWSAPELIGEIIRNTPERFAGIVPILASFHEEELFRPGVLYALARIAEASHGLVLPYRELAFLYLNHRDPACRGGALLVMRALADDTYSPSVAKLVGDKEEFVYYEEGRLVKTTVGELAEETLGRVKG